MPLQKLHPQGSSSNPPHSSKRRQMQERRRTLQTISELSVTEGSSPDFSSFLADKHLEDSQSIDKKTPNFSKRQSLPQYCASPVCIQAQAVAKTSPAHTSTRRDSVGNRIANTMGRDRYEAGWNARRERARSHREQAVCDAMNTQESLEYKYQSGQYIAFPKSAPMLLSRPSQSDLRSFADQQQLLRNSRSMGVISRSHSRQSSSNSIHYDHDSGSSGRTSTDSGSYNPLYGNAVRRSRSGSSSERSFSSQGAPPMPTTSPLQFQQYRPDSAPRGQYLPTANRPAATKPVGPRPDYRSSSLPTIHIDRPVPAPYIGQHTTSGTSPPLAQPKHLASIQRARLESLAALTASPPINVPSHLRNSAPNAHPQRSSLPLNRPNQHSHRPRSHSHANLKVPPHNQPLKHINSIIYDQNPDKTGLNPDSATLQQRSVPKRESLTQWKAEREEVRANRVRQQHARTEERVRRANELEEEKKRELAEIGKGSLEVSEKEKVKWKSEGGCFGGLFTVLRFKGT